MATQSEDFVYNSISWENEIENAAHNYLETMQGTDYDDLLALFKAGAKEMLDTIKFLQSQEF